MSKVFSQIAPSVDLCGIEDPLIKISESTSAFQMVNSLLLFSIIWGCPSPRPAQKLTWPFLGMAGIYAGPAIARGRWPLVQWSGRGAAKCSRHTSVLKPRRVLVQPSHAWTIMVGQINLEHFPCPMAACSACWPKACGQDAGEVS